jgi:hypothetical protein
MSQVGSKLAYALQESVKARSTCERHLLFRFPTHVDLRVGSVPCEEKNISRDPRARVQGSNLERCGASRKDCPLPFGPNHPTSLQH